MPSCLLAHIPCAILCNE
jgi:hypothetical protein